MSPCTTSFSSDPATPEIYTLSLHDALPISQLLPGPRSLGLRRAAPRRVTRRGRPRSGTGGAQVGGEELERRQFLDRKSTRLNSSHTVISYAVFCLKKKKTHIAATAYSGFTS